MTETPASLTYSSVVARDSVRIAFVLAALNELDIRACDIQNAYLTADCREKIYTIAGPEFGSERGKIMVCQKGTLWFEVIRSSLQGFISRTVV